MANFSRRNLLAGLAMAGVASFGEAVKSDGATGAYRKGRIAFMNGDRCMGHINTDGKDHEL